MADKSKAIMSVGVKSSVGGDEGMERIRDALAKEFPQFTFSVVENALQGATINASGAAWSLPGNQRPAMGTMAAWAAGYAKALGDRSIA